MSYFTKYKWGTPDAHIKPTDPHYQHYWIDIRRLSEIDHNGYSIMHEVLGKNFAPAPALAELCNICKELNPHKANEFNAALGDALSYLVQIDKVYNGKLEFIRNNLGPVLPAIVKRWQENNKKVITEAYGSVSLLVTSHIILNRNEENVEVHFLDPFMNDRGHIALSIDGAKALAIELIRHSA